MKTEELDTIDLQTPEGRDFALNQSTAAVTQMAVALFQYYCGKMEKNDALGLAIEVFSESLGNLISLVGENYQQEVLSSATTVIQRGILSQQEVIAEMAYGQIGHS
jgi:uncharacterized protein (UPF0333 family)